MNRAYNVVWNNSTSQYQAVSELSKQGQSKSATRAQRRKGKQLALQLGLASVLACGAAGAQAQQVNIDSPVSVTTATSIAYSNRWVVSETGSINVSSSGSITIVGGSLPVGSIEMASGSILNNAGSVTVQGDLRAPGSGAAGVEFNNLAGATFTNTGSVYSLGYRQWKFDNSGLVTNGNSMSLDTFANNSTGILANTAGGTITVYSLSNAANAVDPNTVNIANEVGTISAGAIDNYGVIFNSAASTIQGTYTNPYLHIHAGGKLDNEGTLRAFGGGITNDGILNNGDVGSITSVVFNNGEMNNHGSVTAAIDNRGTATLDNEAGGVIGRFIATDNVVVNNKAGADIRIETSGVADTRIVIAGAAVLNNEGTITLNDNNGTYAPGNRLEVWQGATVNNDGLLEIKRTQTTSSSGTRLDVDGTFNNNAGGQIVLGEKARIYTGYYSDHDSNPNAGVTTGAVLHNAGSITGSGSGDDIRAC